LWHLTLERPWFLFKRRKSDNTFVCPGITTKTTESITTIFYIRIKQKKTWWLNILFSANSCKTKCQNRFRKTTHCYSNDGAKYGAITEKNSDCRTLSVIVLIPKTWGHIVYSKFSCIKQTIGNIIIDLGSKKKKINIFS
jgi:hypothetical protein